MTFKPGNKDGKGRPKGSRQKLTEKFLLELQTHFFKYGVSALNRMCFDNPTEYIKCVASLVSKDIKIDAKLDIRSESVSQLNSWLEEIATGSITIDAPYTSQDGSLLPAPIHVEQTESKQPLDIQSLSGSSKKPEWLS